MNKFEYKVYLDPLMLNALKSFDPIRCSLQDMVGQVAEHLSKQYPPSKTILIKITLEELE